MSALKAVDKMTRRQRREELIAAVLSERQGSSELIACVADVKACFVKWSLEAATWWVCDLTLDGYDLQTIREAARIVAKQVREPTPADLATEAAGLRRRDEIQPADYTRKQLPAVTGGPRTAQIAIGVYGDISAKLLPADEYEAEFALRRNMTDAELAEHREALKQQAKAFEQEAPERRKEARKEARALLRAERSKRRKAK